MERWRYVLASAIVVALAGALGFVLLRDPEVSPPSTTVATTSTTEPSTTSTTSTTVDRTEEVRLLLEDLWFGWFDAIYRKDPGALWEVVSTREGYEAGLAAMEGLDFTGAPSRDQMKVSGVEVLLDRADCLAVYSSLTVDGFRSGTQIGVDVLWPTDSGSWRIASSWVNKDDLWLADCDLREREETP